MAATAHVSSREDIERVQLPATVKRKGRQQERGEKRGRFLPSSRMSLLTAVLLVSVAVVAAQDIQSPDFYDMVREVLNETKLEPKNLCLEITESGMVSEAESALKRLLSAAPQDPLLRSSLAPAELRRSWRRK